MSTSDAGPSTPLPPRSLNRQQVLEEDEYTAALSHIIARDFFPSLVHLDATNDYLDALRTEDPSLINASVRRLQQVHSTPGASLRNASWEVPPDTPMGVGPSETPPRTPREQPPAKRLRYDTSMSLDMFQAKYTSEDNASFTQILDEENRVRRQRWGWAWDAQRRVELQRDKMLEARERMLIEQPPVPGVREKLVIEPPTIAGLITSGEEKDSTQQNTEDGDRAKAMVVAEPQEEEIVDVLAPKKDTRAAGVDAWKFKTRNSLMFVPDADVSPHDPPPTNGQPDLKVIKHGNTRLSEQETADRSQSLSCPPSPTRSRIDAAISGTPYRPKTPPNSFSFVPNVPSPSATEMEPSALKQLMTWGSLNATPRILSQSGDPAESTQAQHAFKIPPPSNREALSHKLSAHAAKSLRAKANLLGGSTPLLKRTPSQSGTKPSAMAPPSWTPRKADAPGNLTPAARRLLNRTAMSTAATRRAEVMDRTGGWTESGAVKETDLNRVRWTPTPNAGGRR